MNKLFYIPKKVKVSGEPEKINGEQEFQKFINFCKARDYTLGTGLIELYRDWDRMKKEEIRRENIGK